MQEHTATDGLGNVFVVGSTGAGEIGGVPFNHGSPPVSTCPNCGYCPYCHRSVGTPSIPHGPVYPGSFPAWPGPYTTWI